MNHLKPFNGAYVGAIPLGLYDIFIQQLSYPNTLIDFTFFSVELIIGKIVV